MRDRRSVAPRPVLAAAKAGAALRDRSGWDAAPPGPRHVAQLFGAILAERAQQLEQAWAWRCASASSRSRSGWPNSARWRRRWRTISATRSTSSTWRRPWRRPRTGARSWRRPAHLAAGRRTCSTMRRSSAGGPAGRWTLPTTCARWRRRTRLWRWARAATGRCR